MRTTSAWTTIGAAALLAACGDSSAPDQISTIRVTNRSHYMTNPAYIDTTGRYITYTADAYILGHLTTNYSSDTALLIGFVPYDSTSCWAIHTKRYPRLMLEAWSIDVGDLYFATDSVVDFSTQPGWEWQVVDTFDVYGIPWYHGQFHATTACANPREARP